MVSSCASYERRFGQGSQKRLRSKIFWEEETQRRHCMSFPLAGRTLGGACGDEVCQFRHIRKSFSTFAISAGRYISKNPTYRSCPRLRRNIQGSVVGTTELESVTSCMSSKRSNQLSYAPVNGKYRAYYNRILLECQAFYSDF